MPTTETHPLTRWLAPGLAVLIGVAYLVGGLIGGDPWFGVLGLLVMLALGAGVVVASRWSETTAGLLDRRDERINEIDRSATLAAGMTVLAAVIVMFVVEIARGQDGSPYYQLGAIGGVTYVVALVVLRFRR